MPLSAGAVPSVRLACWSGVCAALLPPEHGGPDPVVLARQVCEHLGRVPAAPRAAFHAVAQALDGVALALRHKRLRGLPPRARAEVLRRVDAFSIDTSHSVQALKALVLLVAGADAHEPVIAARAALDRPVRPDGDLHVTPSSAWPDLSSTDAVVVGSGAGGAMAARTLAQAGMRVLVVEEGPRFGVEDFRGRHPLRRFGTLYRAGGATGALGRPPLLLPLGRGVGGTTLVNSGTCYRTPERVLRRWRDEAGLPLADLSRFAGLLDEVERTLQVAPVPLAVMGRNGRLLLDAAATLGWRAGPLQRNAPGCGGCCQCSIGCPRNAKYGVHLNALPQACAAGAVILSDARVERVVHRHGRALGVVARRRDGSRLRVRSPRVIVATGAVETPMLLRRSVLGRHPELGRNLAVHPATGVAGRFPEPVVGWEGVLQSAAVEEFHERDGILIEATATPPGMGSGALPGFGADLVRELRDAAHLGTLGALVADAPSGRVLGSRFTHPLVRYDLAPGDARRLLRAVRIMGHLLFTAGAVEVLTGLQEAPRVRDVQALEDVTERADPRGLRLAAFHPTGTAAAGADAQRSPVDERGRVRGASGVWVADASTLPTSPAVNPQLTIMAMALGIAQHIVEATV